ncbi:MAG: insulinase family protein [Acidobacteria bacterium]|nr:insulinase family protein [Acidobacteriota bacterium]MBI3658654.1 insulinase family protein [Acidobacteriota bacterium]
MRITNLLLTGGMAGAILLFFTAGAPAERIRKIDFKDTTLSNGLRVITVEDHSAPVVSLAVTYNVGSRNERKGRTGFAHLFEHMMFKGSENVGPGEHFVQIFTNGGSMNGTTNEDRTNYFETLPANQLDLAIFLEADRMRSLLITKENLDNQRHAVQEERRLGRDNQPYGKSRETLQELLYDNFAYKHSVIGSMEDLNAATVEDVKQFFKMYYAPSNAVVTLVGDFKTDEALVKVKKYFGDIPGQPSPPTVDMTEPEQKAERRTTVEDPLARLPQITVAYKATPGDTSDFYALQILSATLQSGQSSRLSQKLVKEKELVQSVFGFIAEHRGTGALYITATLQPGRKVEAVEATIYEVIESLKKEPIADWEFQKAKNASRYGFIRSMENSLTRAIMLGQYTVFYNNPDLINHRQDKVAAVKKEDVRRVANKYLNAANRTVVVTLPKMKMATAAVQQ